MIFGNVLSYIFQGYIFWPFFVQIENREEFEVGLEKRKGKGGKEEKRKES